MPLGEVSGCMRGGGGGGGGGGGLLVLFVVGVGACLRFFVLLLCLFWHLEMKNGWCLYDSFEQTPSFFWILFLRKKQELFSPFSCAFCRSDGLIKPFTIGDG